MTLQYPFSVLNEMFLFLLNENIPVLKTMFSFWEASFNFPMLIQILMFHQLPSVKTLSIIFLALYSILMTWCQTYLSLLHTGRGENIDLLFFS